MSRAVYNEIDPYCCKVLRARIADGSLPPGEVDDRDIREVNADDYKEYGQITCSPGSADSDMPQDSPGCQMGLMFSLEDSRVSRSAVPGSEKAREMTATSGRKWLGFCRVFGPAGYLLRMLLDSSRWYSSRWYLIWSPKRTASRHLLAFRLAPSDRITGGNASGFVATPTATANQLSPEMVRKWPSCRLLREKLGRDRLEPEDYERMMDYPDGWTDLKPLGTQSTQR